MRPSIHSFLPSPPTTASRSPPHRHLHGRPALAAHAHARARRAARARRQADVLAQRDVLAVGVAEDARDAAALQAHDARDLDGAVVDEGAADLDGGAVPQLGVGGGGRSAGGGGRLGPLDDDDAHGLLLPERAVHVDDADGQQAGLLEQRGVRAAVDVQRAVRGEAVEQPEAAVADGLRGGGEAGVQRRGWWRGGLLGAGGGAGGGLRARGEERVEVAEGLVAGEVQGLDVGHDGEDGLRVRGARDDGCDAGGGGEARGDDLGGHAAGAEGGAGGGDWGVLGACWGSGGGGGVDGGDGRGKGGIPSTCKSSMSSTTSIASASGFVRGFLVYRQSTSVMRKR